MLKCWCHSEEVGWQGPERLQGGDRCKVGRSNQVKSPLSPFQ